MHIEASDYGTGHTDLPQRQESVLPQRVLIVIPTLNEAGHIEGVLEGLIQELGAFAHMRIIVADGGSTDGTRQLVEDVAQRCRQVEMIDNQARFQSAAVNLAVRRFGHDADVLIRCDAHAIYPSGYCTRLVQSMIRVKADAVVVPMDSVGRTCFQRAVAWVSNSPIGTGGSAHRGGRRSGFVDHGHHAAFRTELFRMVGGYDESFTCNEDAELDCRQRAAGASIYLDGEIRIGYEPRSSARGLWRQYFNYGAGRSRTIRRHPGSARLRQMAVPAHLLVSTAAVMFSPFCPALLVWPTCYVLALAATSLYFAVRHRSLCGLAAGPAAAVMHTAWASGFVSTLLTKREPRWRPKEAGPLRGSKVEAQEEGLA